MLKNNQAKGDGFGFFEIGYTFFNSPGAFNRDQDRQEKLPYQEKKIALAITSKNVDLFSKAKNILTSFCREIIGQDVESRMFSDMQKILPVGHRPGMMR
jgi:hypothetical protein